jgi:hypothetical protein
MVDHRLEMGVIVSGISPLGQHSGAAERNLLMLVVTGLVMEALAV